MKSRKMWVTVLAVVMAGLMMLPGTGAAESTIEGRLIEAGMRYLGTPYQWGADPNQTGTFDCSSYTLTVFREVGILLPRTSLQQSKVGKEIALASATVGDLLFFQTDTPGIVGHVGIYMGDSKMLNATVSKGVRVVDISTAYWMDRYILSRRVIPPTVTPVYGDTLWKISLRTGVGIDDLRVWNGLQNDLITAGVPLYIGNPNYTYASDHLPPVRYHIVQPGDTLWNISVKYGVPMEHIVEWNGLEHADMLYIGQKLFLEAPFTMYTVVQGDTLWLISQKTGIPVEAILDANGLTHHWIYPGQTLRIPQG